MATSIQLAAPVPVIVAHDAKLAPSLRIFTTPPEGHLLHIVPDDRMRPILRKGEVAVFDPDYYWPEDGEYFLRQGGCRTWSGGAIKHHWTIVETARSQRDPEVWWAHPFYRSPAYKATIAAGQIPTRIGGFSDGPYVEVTLADHLIGKLVGIYAPTGEIAQ